MKIATEPVTIGNGVGSNRCEKDEEGCGGGVINNIPPSPSFPLIGSVSSYFIYFIVHFHQ